jgi:sulfate/thiosulfate transport system permease protein
MILLLALVWTLGIAIAVAAVRRKRAALGVATATLVTGACTALLFVRDSSGDALAIGIIGLVWLLGIHALVVFRKRSALPGFGLGIGISLAYLGLMVVIPLSTVVLKTSSLTFSAFVDTITSDRALASFALSVGASLIAATINVVLGTIVAWVLVRYEFPGRRIIDALVDLPFALPTAVAGIALAASWSENGVLGKHLHAIGIDGAYSRLGVVIALTFIGLPFVVRTVQPVLLALDPRVEEVAATLGASRWQTFWRVILPALRPALVTGFALAFARALGEYGSVIFMSGNMPMKTEIAPLLIMSKLEQFDYAGATALALVMLVVSFAILIAINGLTWRASQRRIPTIRKRPPASELQP